MQNKKYWPEFLNPIIEKCAKCTFKKLMRDNWKMGFSKKIHSVDWTTWKFTNYIEKKVFSSVLRKQNKKK